LVGTPLLAKEGKILKYSTITFSSLLRRSTPPAGGGRWLTLDAAPFGGES